MATQSPSSSSSFSSAFTYQVFLSFRGCDTRNGFTGHLYKALIDKGIHTFIGDNNLERGDEITPSLIKAIEESRIFIPVFSMNYTSSSFCLDELVHIIHCYKSKGRFVLPVFFDVDPSHVRHHKCSYGECLNRHEERFQNNNDNMERLHQWKMALTEAANLSGYDYTTGYEYKFIENIVQSISNKISRMPLHVATYPVGLNSKVEQVKSLLDNGSDDGVHMVGIYGIEGLGKSTLARAIYNFVGDQFEGLCFLHDVRENSAKNSLKHLQEKLLLKTIGWEIELDHTSDGIPKIKERLCRKKILLILDDVDNIEQLHALAGGHDWFGPGSIVIITTRNKHLLSSHGIESTLALEGLNETEALKLFRWMAFKSDIVPSGYEEILNRAVAYASGIPLVIVRVGSNLFGKSVEEWKGTLDGYENQVFLSFRGTDTRHGFTGNLYNALTNNGIHTFIDDNDLQRGDEITPSLIKAIEESRIFIPIFSANYAYSSFCLEELVHIIRCYKTKGRLILPVFVGVDPTDVRHHTGSYGEHLTKHEKKFQNNKKNMERLHQWKMALTEAANLSGYHYTTGYEYKFIEKIVKSISNKISATPL